MPQLLNGSQQAANYWANLGFQPVPCVIFYDEQEQRHKKAIGYRDKQNNIIPVSADYKNYRWDKDLTKFDNASVGVICTEKHAVHDHYLVKIDFDQKSLESPDNQLKIKFVQTFRDKKCKVFGTVSGGIGVLILSPVYYPANSEITFQGHRIGHTSDFNVMPPSDGYQYIENNDLGIFSPEDLEALQIKITYKKAEITESNKAQYELGRYSEGLSIMLIAYSQDLYHDSYSEWLRLLLIGRNLGTQYPEIDEALKQTFIGFSQNVGRLSGNYNDSTEAQIETEWSRDDKGGLGIATLEDWVQSFIPQTKGDFKTRLKAFIPSNKTIQDLDQLLLDSYDGLSDEDRIARLLQISGSSNLHQVTKLYDEKLKLQLSTRDAIDSLEAIQEIESQHLELDELIPTELALVINEFSKNMGYEPEGVLLRILTDISALYKTPTKIVLMPDRNFAISPNIYAVIVAPTGVKKGALDTNISQAIYTYPQAVLDQHYRNLIAEWQQDGCKGIEPSRPICLHTDYSTVEGLISQCQEYPDMAILLAQDEIESFFANESYSGRGASQRAFYLKAYDGVGTSYKRLNRTVFVANIQLAISGLIQDDILYKYVNPDNVASGMIGRFMLFQQGKHKPYQGTIKNQIAPILENLGRILVDSIGAMQPSIETDLSDWMQNYTAGTQIPQARKLLLSDEAFQLFTKTYYEIEDQQYEESDPFKAALLGKTQGKIGKVAAALHALKFAWSKYKDQEMALSLPTTIDLETMQAAIEITRFYDSRTLAVYTKADSLKGGTITSLTIKILDIIRRQRKINRGNLNRSLRNVKPTEIESALQVLESQDLIVKGKTEKATFYTIA